MKHRLMEISVRKITVTFITNVKEVLTPETATTEMDTLEIMDFRMVHIPDQPEMM